MSEQILTDEIKQQLLGLAPFSAEAKFDFTPKKLKDPSRKIPIEFQPVYLLSCFTVEERKAVMKELRKPGDTTLGDIKRLVKNKIHGFKNVFDLGTGKEIEFKIDQDKTITYDQMEVVGKLTVEEIFYYLIQASGLMDTEKLGLRY